MGKRRILIVTSARSDFGLLRPLIDLLRANNGFAVKIAVTGMHFSEPHGHTVDEIVSAGYGDILVRLPVVPTNDGALAISIAMAEEMNAFARYFAHDRPDIAVVLGDRYDMLPAPMAALPFAIPVAHIAGGEVTEGVIDDSIRHVVTKLSHLHFVAMPDYAERLKRLGEEPWRIMISGGTGLDRLRNIVYRTKEDVFTEFGLDPAQPLTVFTFHPETLEAAGTGRAIREVLTAAESVGSQILLTYPNSDTGSGAIIPEIETYAAHHSGARCVKSLGGEKYLQVLRYADAMVGNSSSGITEAASYQLPVVNIGDRQKGRMAPKNVIHVPIDREKISAAWRLALSSEFRQSLVSLVNPYGDGYACQRIVERLKTVSLDKKLVTKVFFDDDDDGG